MLVREEVSLQSTEGVEGDDLMTRAQHIKFLGLQRCLVCKKETRHYRLGEMSQFHSWVFCDICHHVTLGAGWDNEVKT